MFTSRTLTRFTPYMTSLKSTVIMQPAKRFVSTAGKASKPNIKKQANTQTQREESQCVINFTVPNSHIFMRPFQAYKENFVFWKNNKFNLLEDFGLFAKHVPQTYRKWYNYSLYFMTGAGFCFGARQQYKAYGTQTVSTVVLYGAGTGFLFYVLTSVVGLWHPVAIPALTLCGLFGNIEVARNSRYN